MLPHWRTRIRHWSAATLATAASRTNSADLAMKNATDLDRTDKDISAYHVPDEALEAAGCADIGPAVTYGCTNVWWCGPGGGRGPSQRLQGWGAVPAHAAPRGRS